VVVRVSAFACVVVPYFLAAAVERVEPALRERPLIVVTGTPPATRVVDVNAAARVLGVHPPMTEAEARAHCPEITSRVLADEVRAAASSTSTRAVSSAWWGTQRRSAVGSCARRARWA